MRNHILHAFYRVVRKGSVDGGICFIFCNGVDQILMFISAFTLLYFERHITGVLRWDWIELDGLKWRA